MEGASRQTFQPAGAGALLASTAALIIAIGGLVGWAVGAAGYGLLIGALLGIPVGVFVVYRRYRGVLS